jgi:acetylornithine/N-succinyldiaminopimelate aminotransferase
MRAVDVEEPLDASDLMERALDHGLVMGVAGKNALRFVPPLILTEDETDELLRRLDSTLSAAVEGL